MKRLLLALFTLTLTVGAHAAADAAKPNVRAITAFVRLDRAHYVKQIDDALRGSAACVLRWNDSARLVLHRHGRGRRAGRQRTRRHTIRLTR